MLSNADTNLMLSNNRNVIGGNKQDQLRKFPSVELKSICYNLTVEDIEHLICLEFDVVKNRIASIDNQLGSFNFKKLPGGAQNPVFLLADSKKNKIIIKVYEQLEFTREENKDFSNRLQHIDERIKTKLGSKSKKLIGEIYHTVMLLKIRNKMKTCYKVEFSEYFENCLFQYIDKYPKDRLPNALEIQQRLQYIEKTLSMLTELEACKVIFTDIKPSNLFLSNNGEYITAPDYKSMRAEPRIKSFLLDKKTSPTIVCELLQFTPDYLMPALEETLTSFNQSNNQQKIDFSYARKVRNCQLAYTLYQIATGKMFDYTTPDWDYPIFLWYQFTETN